MIVLLPFIFESRTRTPYSFMSKKSTTCPDISVKNYGRDIRPTFLLFNFPLYLVLMKTELIFMEMLSFLDIFLYFHKKMNILISFFMSTFFYDQTFILLYIDNMIFKFRIQIMSNWTYFSNSIWVIFNHSCRFTPIKFVINLTKTEVICR